MRPALRAFPVSLVLASGLLLPSSACVTPERPSPGVSEYESFSADTWDAIAGSSGFSDRLSNRIDRMLAQATNEEPAHFHMLALSGGGQDGAFGAGILEAWPRDGDAARPGFDAVTGVSTGALLATSAFLDDPELTRKTAELYSNIGDEDLFIRRLPIEALFRHSGVARYDGLQALLAELLADEVIDRVAQESRTGRTLWVGTTNMDSGAFTPWNLSAIATLAAEGNPDAYLLYRKIVVASASIPAAVEPQYIRGYMHADGGTRRSAFLPAAIPLAGELLATGKLEFHVTVIMNTKVDTAPRIVEPKLMATAGRALEIMIDENEKASIQLMRESFLSIYAKRPDIDKGRMHVQLAYIPADYPPPSPDAVFDTAYMKKLVDFGRTFARERRWFDSAPWLPAVK